MLSTKTVYASVRTDYKLTHEFLRQHTTIPSSSRNLATLQAYCTCALPWKIVCARIPCMSTVDSRVLFLWWNPKQDIAGKDQTSPRAAPPCVPFLLVFDFDNNWQTTVWQLLAYTWRIIHGVSDASAHMQVQITVTQLPSACGWSRGSRHYRRSIRSHTRHCVRKEWTQVLVKGL